MSGVVSVGELWRSEQETPGVLAALRTVCDSIADCPASSYPARQIRMQSADNFGSAA